MNVMTHNSKTTDLSPQHMISTVLQAALCYPFIASISSWPAHKTTRQTFRCRYYNDVRQFNCSIRNLASNENKRCRNWWNMDVSGLIRDKIRATAIDSTLTVHTSANATYNPNPWTFVAWTKSDPEFESRFPDWSGCLPDRSQNVVDCRR